MEAVALTSLLVAAMRANESKREDRLFDDPFADRLAGEEGHRVLADYRAKAGAGIPIIEVRTRWYDEAIASAQSIRQFVILATGMDARAWRLPWAEGTRVFELDQPNVLARKEAMMQGTPLRCERIARAVDLREDWGAALVGTGFDRSKPTVWIIEGLLQYLPPAAIDPLFARIDALSASGSSVLTDVVGRALLTAPPLRGAIEFMDALGSPWLFGSDEPGAPLASRGWEVAVTDPAVIGNAWKRWPFPAIPAHVPNAPRGYLVACTKR